MSTLLASAGIASRMYGLSFSISPALVPLFEPPTHPIASDVAPARSPNVNVHRRASRRIASLLALLPYVVAPLFAALLPCFALALSLRLFRIFLAFGKRAHLGHAFAASGHPQHTEGHPHSGHSHSRHPHSGHSH